MSEERDEQSAELADIIKREYIRAIDRKRVSDCYDAPADAILAAGYRKPRTITTEAELHELQDGSAVSADGDVHIKNGRWVDRLGEFSPAWLLLEMGTVTVLYEPTA